MVSTMAELLAVLEGVGLPVAFDHFEKAQDLPYIIYLADGSNPFPADNINYFETNTFAIELYTAYKSPAVEELLKDALTDAGIYYTTTVDQFLTDEQMYMVALMVTI